MLEKNRMTIRNHWRGGGLQGSQLCWPSVCSKCIARVVTLEMAVLDINYIAAFKRLARSSLKQSLGRSRRHRGITRAVSITQETRGDGRGGRDINPRETTLQDCQFSTQLATSSLTIPPVAHQATPSPTPATPSAIPLSDNQSCNTGKNVTIPS